LVAGGEQWLRPPALVLSFGCAGSGDS
jgi:hypothetical protein